MKKILLLFSLILGCYCLLAQVVAAPSVGDFQSRQSGDWKSATSWSIYTATGWVNASTYPGATNGNYKVYVRPIHEVTISSNSNFSFGDIYILSSVTDSNGTFLRYPNPSDFSSPVPGTTISIGKVTINGNVDVKFLGPSQNMYIYGGTLFFGGNQAKLYMLTGNSLVITNYSTGAGPNTPFGINGVQPVTSQDCQGQMRIYFQTAAGATESQYAICYASAGLYTFHGLNSMGGSLQSIMGVSRNTICTGESITLSGEVTGVVTSQTQYRWLVISQPAGSTLAFPSAFVNTPIVNYPINPIVPGNYVLGLETRYQYAGSFYVSSIDEKTITVNPSTSPLCGCFKNPVLDPSKSFPSQFGVTSVGKDGISDPLWMSHKQNGAMVLESRIGGLVVNRVANTDLIVQPVEGMIVYDKSANCLKIYKTIGGALGWKCLQDAACPTTP